MTTLHLRKLIGRSSLRRTLLLIPLVLACFGLSPATRALSPAPDGGYASGNTAEGTSALFSLTTGAWNTGLGFSTLFFNATGNFNTAEGYSALFSNTTGGWNTANGVRALFNNTTGRLNTATGAQALFSNTTGNSNTANGEAALARNTTGQNNTANGFEALAFNTAGNDNTGEGFHALLNNTGSNNIGLGSNAGSNLTTGDNNIDIGAPGLAGESNKIRIGTVGTHNATFVAGISGSAITGTAVVVNANGRLGVATSSERFKAAIRPMDKASEVLLALKSVTFRYKEEIDPEGIPQFGLVAEEVKKVNPALVTRDAEGKVFTVRYDAVNAMLLNEFLKEHRKVEQHEATIARQQKQIEALTTGLQKVSDQLELSKPAPQVVENNQ